MKRMIDPTILMSKIAFEPLAHEYVPEYGEIVKIDYDSPKYGMTLVYLDGSVGENHLKLEGELADLGHTHLILSNIYNAGYTCSLDNIEQADDGSIITILDEGGDDPGILVLKIEDSIYVIYAVGSDF